MRRDPERDDLTTRVIRRLSRWGWPEGLHGGIVTSSGVRDQVACPLRDATVPLRDCAGCERLVEVRSLFDVGGATRMVLCDTREREAA